MRRAMLVLTIAGALAGAPLTARAQAPAADSIAARDVVLRFHEALARGDSTGAMALLADDAVILEAGGIETRAEYRAHHLLADIQFATAVPGKPGPMRVTLAGDVAWVTSTSETAGTFQGRAVNSAGAELVVLTRAPRGWQIRAIHWSSRRRQAP